MSKKKLSPLRLSKLIKNEAVIQPILEQETPTSAATTTAPSNQISEMLEDIHDMVENVSHMSSDIVETMTSSMALTANLLSNIASGTSECIGDLINHSSTTAEKFMKCSNAQDILSFNHGLFDNHFGVFNQLGMNCGTHMNDFTKGISEVISYNLTNNWLEKFKNKKKYH